MKELQQKIESLAEAVAKLGYVSMTTNDAGLRLILEDIEHDLLQLHHFFDYHTENGYLQWSGGDGQ